MSLRKINAVMRKEFYHLIRDPRSLILAFIIPLCLILLFGYALSLDVNNVGDRGRGLRPVRISAGTWYGTWMPRRIFP